MRRLLTLFLTIMIAAGCEWWYWTTTPEYAIEEARVAVRTHDISKFQKFVDTNSVANGLVDDFLTEPMQRVLGGGIVGQILVGGFVALIRPRIADGVKVEIVRFVETGSFTGKSNGDNGASGADTTPSAEGAAQSQNTSIEPATPNALTGIHLPGSHLTLANYDRKFGFRKHAFRAFKDVHVEGKSADVGILLHNQVYNTDVLLRVQLNQIDSQWEVTRLENFPEFVMTLAKLQMDGAPQPAAPASNGAQQ